MHKPVGLLLLVGFIGLYPLIAAAIVAEFQRPPLLLEVAIYAILGIAWIWLVRPLLVWTQTGRWRSKDDSGNAS